MTTPDLKKLERYHGHDRGVVITQDAPGIFSERPMTRAELAAREPAAAIQDDIFKHANTAGVCYYPIWHLIAATIDTETATLLQEVETLRSKLARHEEAAPQETKP